MKLISLASIVLFFSSLTINVVSINYERNAVRNSIATMYIRRWKHQRLAVPQKSSKAPKQQKVKKARSNAIKKTFKKTLKTPKKITLMEKTFKKKKGDKSSDVSSSKSTKVPKKVKTTVKHAKETASKTMKKKLMPKSTKAPRLLRKKKSSDGSKSTRTPSLTRPKKMKSKKKKSPNTV